MATAFPDGLLKLINNPTWFVATTLIGNNVANYLTSLAIVLARQFGFDLQRGRDVAADCHVSAAVRVR